MPFARSGPLLLALVLAVPACQTPKAKEDPGGCWVRLYDSASFHKEDAWIVVNGPLEAPNMSGLPTAGAFDWDRAIESLQVGPHAKIVLYEGEDFQGETREFGPNMAIPDLGEYTFGNQAQSFRLTKVK